MKTHHEILSGNGLDSYDNYAGDVMASNWLCLMARHRDSDLLAESNWDAALEALGGEGDHVTIMRIGHWAVGWVEMLFIDSEDEHTLHEAEEIEAALESYPVLDEDDFSQREMDAANEHWREYMDGRERVQWLRDHPYDCAFDSFAGLLACARGEYFTGSPSELIY